MAWHLYYARLILVSSGEVSDEGISNRESLWYYLNIVKMKNKDHDFNIQYSN